MFFQSSQIGLEDIIPQLFKQMIINHQEIISIELTLRCMINYYFFQFFLILLLIIQLIKLQPQAAFLIDTGCISHMALLILALPG